MEFSKYAEGCERTKSSNFYLDRFTEAEVYGILNRFLRASAELDALKKLIFYGRSLAQPVQTDSEQTVPPLQLGLHPDIIHSILGLATEGAELVELLKRALFEEGTADAVNLSEEYGDAMYYIAIGLNRAGINFNAMLAQNNAKLRARFPEKFTDAEAINRDLATERAVLEQHQPAQN